MALRSGLIAEEVVGRSLFELFPELQTRGFERYFRQVLSGQTAILSQRFHNYIIPLPAIVGGSHAERMQQSGRIVPLVAEGVVQGTLTILEDVTEQCTYIRESKPEIAALNMGTMNYSKYSRARKAFDFDMVFPNTYEKNITLLKAMNEAGVKPELECFDTGHTQGIWPLIDMGVLKAPLQFSFIVNVLGGIPGLVESLQLQTKIIPPGSEWEVIGISHGQWRMLGAALVLGGNIRCGLEDHLYLPSGEPAKSNGELVEVAVRMTRDVGRTPATVDQAREILGLGAAS